MAEKNEAGDYIFSFETYGYGPDSDNGSWMSSTEKVTAHSKQEALEELLRLNQFTGTVYGKDVRKLKIKKFIQHKVDIPKRTPLRVFDISISNNLEAWLGNNYNTMQRAVYARDMREAEKIAKQRFSEASSKAHRLRIEESVNSHKVITDKLNETEEDHEEIHAEYW